MRIDGGQVVQRRDPTGSIKGATINSGLEEDATYASPGEVGFQTCLLGGLSNGFRDGEHFYSLSLVSRVEFNLISPLSLISNSDDLACGRR